MHTFNTNIHPLKDLISILRGPLMDVLKMTSGDGVSSRVDIVGGCVVQDEAALFALFSLFLQNETARV